MASRIDHACAVVAIALMAAWNPAACAQCSTWPTGVMLPSDGDLDLVDSVETWDPDGGGPLGEGLVVAEVDGVFTFDGLHWSRLGDIGQSPTVARNLTLHNGQPVVVGNFGGQFGVIWRWTGSGWLAIGQGGNIHEMISYAGQLIVGGNLLSADGSSTNNIVRWDGTAWHTLGVGLPATCTALSVFDLDGEGPNAPMLYAASAGGNVHRWDGASWQDLPALADLEVSALAGLGDRIYAGGHDPGQPVTLLRWWSEGDTSWSNVAAHIINNGTGAPYARVNILRAWNGSLIVGGRFNVVNPSSHRNIARYTGTSWMSMDGGLGHGQGIGVGGVPEEVRALAGSPGFLFAGGDFAVIANGNQPAPNIAGWNGVEWVPLISPGQVLALAPFGAQLAIGGWFDSGDPAGTSQMHNIALWNGQSLSNLGSGVNGAVRALREFGSTPTTSTLVAGGEFTIAGGVAVNRVAKFNLSTNPLQTGWFAMGSGFNGHVHALEIGYGGKLIAGGAFTAPGAQPINRMATWDGNSNNWVRFASAGGNDMNGPVRAIKVYVVNPQNPLSSVITVAGGDFTQANGQPRNRIAMWTDNPQNGPTPWAAMGDGFNAPVYAIERHAGSIYAAGDFTASASGAFTYMRIARWTGSAWVVVGNGVGFSGPVFALKSIGGFLYAAGIFTHVDGMPIANLARWNGTAWESVGSMPQPRFVIAPYKTEALFGGDAQYPSVHGVARLSPTGLPWIAGQPAPLSVACGQTADFSVTLAAGYQSIPPHQWRRNGVPLTDGPTPHGSIIGGALTTQLTIVDVNVEDAGTYDFGLTNSCGSAFSSPAALTITTCCPADIAPVGAPDGVVSVSDLLAVINGWGACPAPCPPSCAADFIGPGGSNPDCQVNVSDLLALINAWGPCP